MQEVHFDDIEAIRRHVSEDYGPFGGEFHVSQGVIDRFAELTGDHQWIHVDVERARRESPFGNTIAHGFLTLSLLAGAAPPGPLSYRLVGHGNAVNYGSDKLRFLSPVPAGSKVHSRSRLASVEAGKNGTRVETENAIHVVGNERPAVLYNGIFLYQPKRG